MTHNSTPWPWEVRKGAQNLPQIVLPRLAMLPAGGERACECTVLIVEDETDLREIAAELLEDEGYRVLQAASGEIALEMLAESTPHLILSDVMMAGMDGFTLYQQVHANQQWSQIPFIFLTGRGRRADMRRGMELGADDYLTKPFEPEHLLAAVKVRLARAAENRTAVYQATTDMRETIMRMLNHEFRTPMTLVLGYSELLEETVRQMDDRNFDEFIRGLSRGSRRLMNLVEDLLLLSEIESGELVGRQQSPARTNAPDEVVADVLAEFCDRAAAASIVLACNCPGAPIAIAPEHLANIVRRLVDNAVKFSKPAGGQVLLTAHQDERLWELEVVDEGCGIPAHELRGVFEAFRQVDRVRSEQQGAGLGLAIARGLAALYGGRITAASQPGQGSRFSLALPLVLG